MTFVIIGSGCYKLVLLSSLEEFHRAAVVVQRRWKAKQYKKQFDYLKHAICVAVSGCRQSRIIIVVVPNANESIM